MNGRRSSLLRAAPAYWACIAILLLMAGYSVVTLTMTPESTWAESLAIVGLFFITAFAPGTFTLLLAVGVLIFNTRPGVFIRIGTYVTTLYYVAASVVLNQGGLL